MRIVTQLCIYNIIIIMLCQLLFNRKGDFFTILSYFYPKKSFSTAYIWNKHVRKYPAIDDSLEFNQVNESSVPDLSVITILNRKKPIAGCGNRTNIVYAG